MRGVWLSLGFTFFLLPTTRNALAGQAEGSNVEELQAVAIIVHADNPIETVHRIFLERVFLAKRTRWENGSKIRPIDVRASQDLRTKFSRVMLLRSSSAVRAYWQRAIFSGKGTPPPIVKTEEDVQRFVQEEPNAIGYITAGTDLLAGVKRVEVLP